jgi:hypothetical protein
MKRLLGWVGMLSIFFGIGLMWNGHFVYGMYSIMFGLVIAIVIMFWGFSGTMEKIIEKHTGLYSLDDKKSTDSKPQKRRKW